MHRNTSSTSKGAAQSPFIEAVRASVNPWIAQAPTDLRRALEHMLLPLTSTAPLPLAMIFEVASRFAPVQRHPDERVLVGLTLELMRAAVNTVESLLARELVYDDGALHRRFDKLTAIMVSGYMISRLLNQITWLSHKEASVSASSHSTSSSVKSLRHTRSFDLRLVCEFLQRVALARCSEVADVSIDAGNRRNGPYNHTGRLGLAQWRLRTRESIASMFEVSACLGARSEEFRSFGRALGLAYQANVEREQIDTTTAYELPYEDMDVKQMEPNGSNTPRACLHRYLHFAAAVAHRDDFEREKLLKTSPRGVTPHELARALTKYRTTARGEAIEVLKTMILEARQAAAALGTLRKDELNSVVDQLVPLPSAVVSAAVT